MTKTQERLFLLVCLTPKSQFRCDSETRRLMLNVVQLYQLHDYCGLHAGVLSLLTET